MFLDEEPIILEQPTYIPDQELYPGKTFSSYSEMKAACPLLDIKQDILDQKKIPYTPYRVTYEKGA